MTLQQALEKLAVVAGDFVTDMAGGFYRIGNTEFGETNTDTMAEVLPGRVRRVEWETFGAICEKIEAEGWDWASHRFTDTPDGQAEYYFGINPMGSTEDGELGCGVSTEHPAHAAAKALLAALEAKKRDSIKGLIPASNMIDTFVPATGKQSNQKEQINE